MDPTVEFTGTFGDGIDGLARIRTFSWKEAHQVLMVNVEHFRRPLANSKACPLCGDSDESLFHCFSECKY